MKPNSNNFDWFPCLSELCPVFQEYQSVLDLMRDIILATDLAHHLRSVKEQDQLSTSEYNYFCLLTSLLSVRDLTFLSRPRWELTRINLGHFKFSCVLFTDFQLWCATFCWSLYIILFEYSIPSLNCHLWVSWQFIQFGCLKRWSILVGQD